MYIGNSMDESAAIQFLRALIHEPPSRIDNGKLNLGWCCNEHAYVATLALRASGVDALNALGEVMVFDQNLPHKFSIVVPHRFVVVSSSLTKGVFDSSISHKQIEGLPTDHKLTYPQVAAFLLDAETSIDRVRQYLSHNPEHVALAYISREASRPLPHMVTFSTENTFSKWVEREYGDQEQIWASVIATTVRLLTREPHGIPLECTRENTIQLWEWLKGLPDQRDFVEERMQHFWGQRPLLSLPDFRRNFPVSKVGRNSPCPCGSGKKYKHCHGDIL